MRDDDCKVFFDNVASLKERERAIAAELRKGHPSKRFCRLLAAMIDGEKNITEFAFTFGRSQPGQPAKGNVELGKAGRRAIAGVKRGHQKKVKEAVAKKFGKSVRTLESAMRDQKRVEELCRAREADEAERNLVSWPSGLEDEIKREEMPE